MKDKLGDLNNLQIEARKLRPDFLLYFKKNKNKLSKMDSIIHQLHDEVSAKTDCLLCANCCRSLGPAIYDKDIDRIAKALKIKPSKVVDDYLRIDEDGDYVFKSMPCPFLMDDNYCSIYEFRPKACKEYPHTDRKNFVQIYKLTVENTLTCPIAFEVLKQLIKK